MNTPNIRERMTELEKEFNKMGYFKIHEDTDTVKGLEYPWSVLFIRYEAYCFDTAEAGMTLEKHNRKIHNKVRKNQDGTVIFPKKAIDSPYNFIYMDLNEITVYDVLPESELGSLFSQLASHRVTGVPTIHKFTPTELIETTKITTEYQELMCEMAQGNNA